jgi:hypothetical protein
MVGHGIMTRLRWAWKCFEHCLGHMELVCAGRCYEKNYIELLYERHEIEISFDHVS